jgi:hypothetical protein
MLEDLKPQAYSPPCKVRELAETLEENDAKILMQAVEDVETWGAIALRNALQKRGVLISDKPIQRHRDRRCDC